MTWPPTRPVRRRLFGVIFLAVWVAGMFLCWFVAVESWTPDMVLDDAGISQSAFTWRYGFSEWLLIEQPITESSVMRSPSRWRVEPRGLVVGVIMTIVSSLVLFVAWRAAVNAFTCAAGTCDGCGYDLTGLAEPRCPECGEMTRGNESGIRSPLRGG